MVHVAAPGGRSVRTSEIVSILNFGQGIERFKVDRSKITLFSLEFLLGTLNNLPWNFIDLDTFITFLALWGG